MNLTEAVRIRARYRTFPVAGEGLFLVSDHDTRFYEGAVFVDLAGLLLTGTSPEQAADRLAASHERAVTHYALLLMEREEVLTSANRDMSAAFLDELELDPLRTRERLAKAGVAVTALAGTDAGTVVEALVSLGVQASAASDPASDAAQIVLTTDYLVPDLEAIDRLNREMERPWLLVRTTGGSLWLGPWFDQSGPCYACLAAVLGTNRATDRYIARKTGSRVGLTGSHAHTPIHEHLVAGLVALETVKRLGEPNAARGLRVVDLRTLDSSEHPVRQRPQCLMCGDPSLQTKWMTAPPRLDHSAAREGLSLADLRRLVSPVTGIVSAVQPIESGLSSSYAATAFGGFGGDAPDLQGFKNSVISQGAGVGTTAEEAEYGAICEALERYSCMAMGDEPFVLARYADLDAASAVNPEACLLYSERQYKRRAAINQQGAAFNVVPEPFDEQVQLAWTGVWSLSANRFKLVPTSLLFYFFPQTGGPYCWADSNGCAAGATLADAVTRGLYELVERDSVAIWWYNRLRRPGLRLEATGDDELVAIADAYRDLNRDVWALDLTADLGIPTFAAISARLDSVPEDIVLGFGADIDPHRALRHAVLEMNHILPAVLPSARTSDGDYPYPEPAQKAWWRTASVENQPYLLPSTWVDELPPAVTKETSRSDSRRLMRLLAELEAADLEVLVFDMTRPDVQLPVAKVIVPGLRHFWARLAPGRLYDVPVSLGWLPGPTPEDKLNPISMFL